MALTWPSFYKRLLYNVVPSWNFLVIVLNRTSVAMRCDGTVSELCVLLHSCLAGLCGAAACSAQHAWVRFAAVSCVGFLA